MIPIKQEDLKVGMIVVMTQAGSDFPGLKHRIFKVVSIDDPYLVIRLTDFLQGTYMIVASEAEFSVPSDETIAAVAPSEHWPTEIG